MKIKKDTLLTFLTLAPSVVLVGVFVYGFIGNTVWVSLTDWGREQALALERDLSFVGLSNYLELFTGVVNSRFRQDIINVIMYSVSLVGGAIAVGLLLSIILDRRPRGRSVYRTIFLYPMSLSFIVSGTIWRWMLAPQGGVNLLPTLFGMERFAFQWLSSRTTVLQFNWQHMPRIMAVVVALALIFFAFRAWKARGTRAVLPLGTAALVLAAWGIAGRPRVLALPFEEMHGFNLATVGIIMAAVWQYSGYTMAMFYAGLQGVPEQLYDAARIDGASDLQYYLRVAIPLLRTTALSAVIILSHISLKMFALIFAMAGPDNAETGHLAVLMYLKTFRANNFAMGAATAVVLFLIASLFIIPYLVSQHRGGG
jgi:glucose/mannose transport system permease protein